MMKADVLNIFEEINICTHYVLPNGDKIDKLSFEITDLDVKPVYQTMKGWHCSLADVRSYDEFPAELKEYVTFLETELQVPINLVSVGPDRVQTILK
jgi:adenylosuccinate synthase